MTSASTSPRVQTGRPASLPQAHADKRAPAAAKAVREPAAVKLLASKAALAVGSTASAFARFNVQEQQRWKPAIVRPRIKQD